MRKSQLSLAEGWFRAAVCAALLIFAPNAFVSLSGAVHVLISVPNAFVSLLCAVQVWAGGVILSGPSPIWASLLPAVLASLAAQAP